MIANSPGRPKGTKKALTEEILLKLQEGFQKSIVLKHAALYAGETPYHVDDWLKTGEDDANHQISSIYSQLFLSVGQNLAKKVADYISKLEACPKNFQSITWLLANCFRKEFGTNADEIQELIRNIDLLNKLKQGGLINGEAQGESQKQTT